MVCQLLPHSTSKLSFKSKLLVNKIWIGLTTILISSIATTCQLPLAEYLSIAQQPQTISVRQQLDTAVSSPSTTPQLQGKLATTSSVSLSAIEQGIVAEMNRARANPPAYRQVLMSWRGKFRGKEAQLKPRVFLRTQEGIPAVDEAIQVLHRTLPVPALTPSKGLTLAARDHVRDQGKKGITGHNGSDGSTPFQRMERYGKWEVIAGENIAYGPDTAQAVVRDLIVDDGVPDRGHRDTIFQRKFRVTGVACGYHRRYRVMCSIEYAGGYRDR
jgi:uncharacterized protein YkwD